MHQAGFVALPISVLRDERLTMSAKMTFAIVLSYAWNDNPCYASVERMAEEAGVSRTACYDALRELRAAGLVSSGREVVNKRLRRVFRPVLQPISAVCPESGIRISTLEVDKPSRTNVSGGPPNHLHYETFVELAEVSGEAA